MVLLLPINIHAFPVLLLVIALYYDDSTMYIIDILKSNILLDGIQNKPGDPAKDDSSTRHRSTTLVFTWSIVCRYCLFVRNNH